MNVKVRTLLAFAPVADYRCKRKSERKDLSSVICHFLRLQPLCVERSWLINSFVSVGAEIIALGLQ